MKLTPSKLFGQNALTGPLPGNLKFSSAGHVSFTLPSQENNKRQDLWWLDPETEELAILVNSNRFETSNADRLTSVEREEQERLRSFNQGITHYEWFPSSEALLIVADGFPFFHEVRSNTSTILTSSENRQSHTHLSPLGNYISCVRNGDLHLLPLEKGAERQLTHNTRKTISNGVPEFIAQEEMHRFEGYWWSSDDKLIAFTRVDTSVIPETYRYEINHSDLSVIPQRYPYAGGRNAQVELGLIDVEKDKTVWLDWRIKDDDYLARVAWSLDGLLVIQVQSRDQKVLSTRAYAPKTDKWTNWYTESTDTWIELNDNIFFTPLGLLTTSESQGKSDLAFFNRQSPSKGLQIIPTEVGRINKIIGNFDHHVYVSGWHKNPTTQDLIKISLETGKLEIITDSNAWHEPIVNEKTRKAVSIVGRPSQPLSVIRIDIPTTKISTIYNNKIQDGHPYFPFVDSHVNSEIGKLMVDGINLFYRLTPPARLEKGALYPVIVSVYGGPGVQRVKSDWPPLVNQLFAQNGYGVFELDNRGGGNRDKAFRDVLYGQLGNIEVSDQLVGVEFLKTIPWVDPKRIGVFGHSYGGYMTLMCLSKAPEAFAAGVSVAPVYSWRLYDTHYTERYLGDPEENEKAYDKSGVEAHITRLNKPLLLIHGMADDNVQFTNATMLMRTLQDQGNAFQLMTYPGSKHSLQESPVAKHRYKTTLDFLQRYL